MALVDVVIPTHGRPTGLAVVLTRLLGQTLTDFDVIVSSQASNAPSFETSIEIQTLVRALEWHGHTVALHHHLPRRGTAEQGQFQLMQSRAPYVHFLDDDVLVDPPVMRRMLNVLQMEGCGFVGAAATGPHLLEDVRPQQQHIELWEGPVRPEPFTPETPHLDRHLVNNAANPLHLERRLAQDGRTVRYKVCWVGGANVLYDRQKLLNVGGFSWWRRLPPEHAGEEALAQFLLIRRYGGCGILPSGTYHLGLPTTIADRRFNATKLFGELLAESEEQERALQLDDFDSANQRCLAPLDV